MLTQVGRQLPDTVGQTLMYTRLHLVTNDLAGLCKSQQSITGTPFAFTATVGLQGVCITVTELLLSLGGWLGGKYAACTPEHPWDTFL